MLYFTLKSILNALKEAKLIADGSTCKFVFPAKSLPNELKYVISMGYYKKGKNPVFKHQKIVYNGDGGSKTLAVDLEKADLLSTANNVVVSVGLLATTEPIIEGKEYSLQAGANNIKKYSVSNIEYSLFTDKKDLIFSEDPKLMPSERNTISKNSGKFKYDTNMIFSGIK